MDGFVTAEFRLPAEVAKKGKFYISSCPLLQVMSQGESKAEALKNLEEALTLFLESCFRRGTLGQVLQESGFKLDSVVHIPAKSSRSEDRYVKIPLALHAHGHAATHAH